MVESAKRGYELAGESFELHYIHPHGHLMGMRGSKYITDFTGPHTCHINLARNVLPVILECQNTTSRRAGTFGESCYTELSVSMADAIESRDRYGLL